MSKNLAQGIVEEAERLHQKETAPEFASIQSENGMWKCYYSSDSVREFHSPAHALNFLTNQGYRVTEKDMEMVADMAGISSKVVIVVKSKTN